MGGLQKGLKHCKKMLPGEVVKADGCYWVVVFSVYVGHQNRPRKRILIRLSHNPNDQGLNTRSSANSSTTPEPTQRSGLRLDAEVRTMKAMYQPTVTKGGGPSKQYSIPLQKRMDEIVPSAEKQADIRATMKADELAKLASRQAIRDRIWATCLANGDVTSDMFGEFQRKKKDRNSVLQEEEIEPVGEADAAAHKSSTDRDKAERLPKHDMTAVDVGGLGFFLNLTAEELQNDFGLEPTKSSDFFQQMDTVLRDAEPERAAAVSDFAASEDADAKSRPKAKHKKNEIDLELDLEDYDEHEHDAQGKNNETEQNFNAGTHLPDHRDPYKAEQEQIRYDAIHKVGGVRDAIRRLRLRQVQGRAEKVQKKSADAAVAGASEDSHLKQDEDILILEGHVRPLDHADRSSNDLAPTRAVRPNDRRERTSRTRSESKATADAPHLTEASVTNMEGSQVENVERGDIPGAVLMPISGKGGTAAARPSAAPSSTSSPPSAPPVMKKLSHFQEVELFKEMAKKGGVAAATSTKTKSSLSSGSFQDVVEEDKIYEQSSGKRVRAQFDGARVSKSSKKRRQDNGTDDRQENSDGKSLKFKFHHPLLERVCDGRAREQSLKDITLDRVHAGKEVELEMVGMWRSLKKEAKAAAAYEDYVFALSDLKNPQ